ncbi:TPA: conjugative transfer ATPase [Shewanella algae]|uniref:conjugative transfer ATPase n=1 Tax=Shewanella algae TaxID=38313 RepID=UPI001C58D8D0|nr:conjugative transfer ATPase [Shewanella algae]HDS1208455.1 conjugative transfer ATPase [Shewanella algae]
MTADSNSVSGLSNFLNKSKLYLETIVDTFRLHEREPNEMITDADMDKLYRIRRSFTDKLPYKDYLAENKCFLLDDDVSVAAVYDISPVNGEGVRLSELAKIRNNFQIFLQTVFPAHDSNPWVVEFFHSDTLSLKTASEEFKEYSAQKCNGLENVKYNQYIQDTYDNHYRSVCKDGGFFVDSEVTQIPWRGATKTYRMIFYRRYGTSKNLRGVNPEQELHDMCLKVETACATGGLKLKRVNGDLFWEWMFRWFNPKPKVSDIDTLIENMKPDFGVEEGVYGQDFSETLMFNAPSTDDEHGTIEFDGVPHKIVTVQNLNRMPGIGAITAPKRISDDKTAALFDSMPEGSVLSVKVTIAPMDAVEDKLEKVESGAKGTDAKTERVKEEVAEVKGLIARGEVLYPTEVSVFIRGDNLKELKRKEDKVFQLLQQAGMNAINYGDDLISIDSYIRTLPMCYEPSRDKSRRRSRFMRSQHIANIIPFIGRGTGTGHPGISLFNRGGESMSFDPLNKLDRTKNAHMLMFGPTGAGKSASLVSIIMQMCAVHRPRIFIVEAGNSFGLMRSFLKKSGFTTNRVVMGAGTNTVIPPFANAIKALEIEEANQAMASEFFNDPVQEVLDEFEEKGSISEVEDEDEEYVKDYLGEMEIIARIMVSGGDKERSNNVSLGDQQLLRECILAAAKAVRERGGSDVLTEDVSDQIYDVSQQEKVPGEIRTRFYEYAAAMRRFTEGLPGRIFNRPGKLWGEADITHIDLKEFVKDNAGAELAVSFMSILNYVNDIAERDQYTGRPIIFLTDEAHVITKNPLLSPGVVKIVKMWRKLNAWLWMATQNMGDFPDEAAVMLSLFEFWILLAMEPSEVDEVARFKKLTDDQRHLILAAKKQPNAYTEGVVLSSKLTQLFRAVPPSIMLALGDTEAKKERKSIMEKYSMDEATSAEVIAQQLDIVRGIQVPNPIVPLTS